MWHVKTTLRSIFAPLRAMTLHPLEGIPLGVDVQCKPAAGVLSQPVPFYIGHVDRGDIEIAIFEKREGVHRANHLRIARGGGNDRLRRLRLSR